MSKQKLSAKRQAQLDETFSDRLDEDDFVGAQAALDLGARIGGDELHRAAAAGKFKTLVFLLDRGAPGGPRPEAPHLTPLHEAVLNEHHECALLLMDRSHEDAKAADPVNGHTPLMFAMNFGPLHVAEALVPLSNVDAVDKEGLSAVDMSGHKPSNDFLEAWILAKEEKRALDQDVPASSTAKTSRI